jgi:hypothetical protein
MTLVNLVLYLTWGETISLDPNSPKRYRRRAQQIRTELICLSKQLEIEGLDDAARGGRKQPGRYHALDIFFSSRQVDPSLLPGVDTVVQLSDGEAKVHSILMCERCPFFNGIFHGRAGGRWLSGRQNSGDLVSISLTHFSSWAFDRVLRWVYADQLQSLFEDVIADTVDLYLDKIIEVLSIADELMIQPLAEVCQSAISKHSKLD